MWGGAQCPRRTAAAQPDREGAPIALTVAAPVRPVRVWPSTTTKDREVPELAEVHREGYHSLSAALESSKGGVS